MTAPTDVSKGEYAIRVIGPDQYEAQKMNWFWKIRRFLHIDRYIGAQDDLLRVHATVTAIYSKPPNDQKRDLKYLQEVLSTVSRSAKGEFSGTTYTHITDLQKRIGIAIAQITSSKLSSREKETIEEVAEKMIRSFATSTPAPKIQDLRALVAIEKRDGLNKKGNVAAIVSRQLIQSTALKLTEELKGRSRNQENCKVLLKNLDTYIENFEKVFGTAYLQILALPLQDMGLFQASVLEAVANGEKGLLFHFLSIWKVSNDKKILLRAACENPGEALKALKKTKIEVTKEEKEELEKIATSYCESIVSRIHQESGDKKWSDIYHFGQVQKMFKSLFPQIAHVTERAAIDVAEREATDISKQIPVKSLAERQEKPPAVDESLPVTSQEVITKRAWHSRCVREWKDHCMTTLRAIAEERDGSTAKTSIQQLEEECLAIQGLFPDASVKTFSVPIMKFAEELVEVVNKTQTIESLQEAIQKCERCVKLMQASSPMLARELKEGLKMVPLGETARELLCRDVIKNILSQPLSNTEEGMDRIRTELNQLETILKFFNPSEKGPIPKSLSEEFGQQIAKSVIENLKISGQEVWNYSLVSSLERATTPFSGSFLTECFRVYVKHFFEGIAKNQTGEQEKLVKRFIQDVRSIWPYLYKDKFLDDIELAIPAQWKVLYEKPV
jgi:hypothetical protein